MAQLFSPRARAGPLILSLTALPRVRRRTQHAFPASIRRIARALPLRPRCAAPHAALPALLPPALPLLLPAPTAPHRRLHGSSPWAAPLHEEGRGRLGSEPSQALGRAAASPAHLTGASSLRVSIFLLGTDGSTQAGRVQVSRVSLSLPLYRSAPPPTPPPPPVLQRHARSAKSPVRPARRSHHRVRCRPVRPSRQARSTPRRGDPRLHQDRLQRQVHPRQVLQDPGWARRGW